MGEVTQADAAQTELAVHRLGATATLATGVGAHTELRFAGLLDLECCLSHGSRSLLLLGLERGAAAAFDRLRVVNGLEGEPEVLQQRPALDVVGGRGHERDVHAADAVDLVLVDLQEHDLLVQPEGVVALAIELATIEAAKLRMERDSVPEELDEITRRLKQLEIEREAIKRENDEPKMAQLDKDIAELREQEKAFRAKWESERALVNKIQQDKLEIERLNHEADRAEREGNYERVAEIRYGKLKELDNDIENIKQQLQATQGGEGMVREEVTADDIAEVVSRWTGIPVTRMLQSEREKLLHLEEELHRRVIAQDEAIAAVSDAVRRSRAGLQDPKRPIASFIFLGTTGVGKTELAKALAEYLFNDESMMTRIDMSEYQEKFSVSRLIGAPPGYVGYDEGGQLTEAVRRKPYSVVLFDEIEKAHPDVFNILLQVLDDGRLTDNKGRTVNFKNTIIIMTSNLGSQYIQQQCANLSEGNRDEVLDETRQKVMDMLKQTIRPEFLNRIDETIMFLPLTKQEIAEVVRLQMRSVGRMLAEQGFKIDVSDEAIALLADLGYDPEFGARPVKRAIQRYVLNDLSKKILAEEVSRDKPILIDALNGKLMFRN